MTDPGASTSRRFNEKEVALIIKRASELQQTETTTESNTGMSLAELEQVAREAGLDPELVRRAAADLDTRVTDQTPNRFLGAPTVLRLERTIDGEVPADEYEPMVLEMQRVLGGVGTASTLGRTLQFSMTGRHRHHATGRDVQVTVTPARLFETIPEGSIFPTAPEAGPSPVPKIETISPGAIDPAGNDPARNDAPFTTQPGSIRGGPL